MTAERMHSQSALAVHFGAAGGSSGGPGSGGRGASVALLPQGGDPRTRAASVGLDLSTCVSRYGPAPAAAACLARMGPEILWVHPYDAADRLVAAYGAYLGVDPAELVAARGISELIWLLAASPLGSRVMVALPAYTEYRQAFPNAAMIQSQGAGIHHDLASLQRGLAAGGVVLISNPHNPSGRAFERGDLEAVARVGGGGLLVVDESYVEFTAEPSSFSLVGTDCANVIVFRSPSKFFGIAGARVGVAWSRNPNLVAWLSPPRGSWPLSGIEVALAEAALGDTAWAEVNRRLTLADGVWLDRHLRHLGQPVGGAVTHFRLVLNPEAERVQRHLAKLGLGVRLVGRGHGLADSAIRVAAPRNEERPEAAALLASVVG